MLSNDKSNKPESKNEDEETPDTSGFPIDEWVTENYQIDPPTTEKPDSTFPDDFEFEEDVK